MAYCSEMKKWGSEGQKLCENWVCKKCVKISCHPFGISNATTSAATNMLKVLSILLEATTNRSLVEQEDLEWYYKSAMILEISHNIYNFVNSFRTIVFSHRPCPKTETEKQSQPDPLKESRLVMTTLTILGVTGIIWDFMLALEQTFGSFP